MIATHIVKPKAKRTLCGKPILPDTSWILQGVARNGTTICWACIAYEQKGHGHA